MQNNLKHKKPHFKVISDVRDYLSKLDKEEKIDLQKIAPGEFYTICQLILDCQDLADPKSVKELINASKEACRK